MYGLIILLRNWFFDKGFLKSSVFNFPIICVGNLATGGTGKTPMVEYLVMLLKNKYAVATLSRGYKRKTEGFGIANESTTALEIGDEPMQFHQKFPDITVAVGEERLEAIPQLLHDVPDTELIILDDAYQHRSVQAGLNILLTESNNLYTRDFLMPAGDLRDVRLSARRADIIIVTKCMPLLTNTVQAAIHKELSPKSHQQLFFTTLEYGSPYHLFSKSSAAFNVNMDVLLICGIANPKPLKDFLTGKVQSYDMLRYPDHHIFLSDDLADIRKQYHAMQNPNKMIITTEKDGVRLQKFEKDLEDLPVYVLPVKHRFLFDEAAKFESAVMNFMDTFRQKTAVDDL